MTTGKEGGQNRWTQQLLTASRPLADCRTTSRPLALKSQREPRRAGLGRGGEGSPRGTAEGRERRALGGALPREAINGAPPNP